MSHKALLTKIKEVERIASTTKLGRLFHHPYRYLYAILHRELIYKRNKKEKEVVGRTFFDTEMHLLLPSSTDIYLTGGKSHDSEIRLAKLLINQLTAGDTLIDIGAHYGYFSSLASRLVGQEGRVFSFEASPTTYRILQKNSAHLSNITSYNFAVSDTNAELTFHEFSNLYSEYNSLDVTQFENEEWYIKNKPKQIKIKSILLDAFIIENDVKPCIIKIDVEGAEYQVMSGLVQYLKEASPIIVMEYLSTGRSNDAHLKAENLLKSLDYYPNIIKSSGEIQSVESVSDYMQETGIESDNIAFVKSV